MNEERVELLAEALHRMPQQSMTGTMEARCRGFPGHRERERIQAEALLQDPAFTQLALDEERLARALDQARETILLYYEGRAFDLRIRPSVVRAQLRELDKLLAAHKEEAQP